MIVAHPGLIADRISGKLDAPGQSGAVQRLAYVVAGLHRQRDTGGANAFDDLVHARMVFSARENLEDCDARRGGSQPGVTQASLDRFLGQGPNVADRVESFKTTASASWR